MSSDTEPAQAPMTLEGLAEAVKHLCEQMESELGAGDLTPESEQFALLVLDTLGQAHRFATLALYAQRQRR